LDEASRLVFHGSVFPILFFPKAVLADTNRY
jgi:hypothetical protein